MADALLRCSKQEPIIQKVVEVPQIQFNDRVVDVPVTVPESSEDGGGAPDCFFKNDVQIFGLIFRICFFFFVFLGLIFRFFCLIFFF